MFHQHVSRDIADELIDLSLGESLGHLVSLLGDERLRLLSVSLGGVFHRVVVFFEGFSLRDGHFFAILILRCFCSRWVELLLLFVVVAVVVVRVVCGRLSLPFPERRSFFVLDVHC